MPLCLCVSVVQFTAVPASAVGAISSKALRDDRGGQRREMMAQSSSRGRVSPRRYSSSASSASFSSASCDSAKDLAQRASSSISASSHAASSSCRSGESLESLARTSFKSLVMAGSYHGRLPARYARPPTRALPHKGGGANAPRHVQPLAPLCLCASVVQMNFVRP